MSHSQLIVCFLFLFRERFLVLDYSDKFEEALAMLSQWYLTGKIKVLMMLGSFGYYDASLLD